MSGSAVRDIHSKEDYVRALAEAGGKLVVVDFTAAWCGPCKAIAPEVDRLSIKYPHVVFLKVDVDKVQAVAQEARVSAMPTFHFLKNRVKVADIVGAQRDKLEPTIKQHETAADLGAGEGSGSATKTQTTVAGHGDLDEYIERKQVNSLNEDSKHTTRNMIDGKGYLLSDADEQLMIEIPFGSRVKLHSIAISSKDKASAPKSLKLYANRSKLGFNEVDSVPAEQELELSESDIEGAPIQLKFVKFQKVSNLQIFVENNQGGGEITRIDSLKFFGAPEQTPNVNNLKKVEE